MFKKGQVLGFNKLSIDDGWYIQLTYNEDAWDEVIFFLSFVYWSFHWLKSILTRDTIFIIVLYDQVKGSDRRQSDL